MHEIRRVSAGLWAGQRRSSRLPWLLDDDASGRAGELLELQIDGDGAGNGAAAAVTDVERPGGLALLPAGADGVMRSRADSSK